MGKKDQDNEDREQSPASNATLDGDQPLSPRGSQSIAKMHPPSQILTPLHEGVKTRSGFHSLQTLCAMEAFVSLQEPKRIKEALKDRDWVKAMKEELEEFEQNRVWKLVPRPQEGKSIF